MRFRKLRIAWSVFLGLACVLLVTVWVRSYFKIDYVQWWSERKAIGLATYHGRLGMVWMNFNSTSPAESQDLAFHSYPISEGKRVVYKDGTGQPLPSYLGFQSSLLSASARWQVFNVVVPYWFPTFVCGLGAALPWLRKLRWRFSLSTLLIATTLIAAVLGLIVWAARK